MVEIIHLLNHRHVCFQLRARSGEEIYQSERGSGAIDIREFKIHDATVTKTSLKIASSSLSIFSIVVNLFNF